MTINKSKGRQFGHVSFRPEPDKLPEDQVPTRRNWNRVLTSSEKAGHVIRDREVG